MGTRLLYSATNAMTREQYALRCGMERAGMVQAGRRSTRNSPAEQPGDRPGWRPISAPMSGPTVGL